VRLFSARTFGQASAAVLALLWTMIFATIWKFGLYFPSLHWEAFGPENLNYTLGGYARILALMTGIEIFASLVAAYDGPARVRSKKAFWKSSHYYGDDLSHHVNRSAGYYVGGRSTQYRGLRVYSDHRLPELACDNHPLHLIRSFYDL
jgi:hypothetical protein